MCTNPDDNNYKYRNLKMEKPLQIICRQSLLLLLDEAFIFPEAKAVLEVVLLKLFEKKLNIFVFGLSLLLS